MAMAYAALANGGKLFVPQVVERVESSDGQRDRRVRPEGRARRSKIAAPTLSTPGSAACGRSTNEPGGTAFDHGHSEIVTVMGKTGTAEVKKHHKDEEDEGPREAGTRTPSHAWFAGWAPAEDPEIAIVVLVEHGGAGGTVAWPIAKQILEGYFTASVEPRRRQAPTAKAAGKASTP